MTPSEYPQITQHFIRAGIREPDYIFDATILDPAVRKERGVDVPLHQTKENGYTLPGCYAWIGDTENDGLQTMYAGKAIGLRGRLVAEWLNGEFFLKRWFDDSQGTKDNLLKDNLFCPFVAVWFTKAEDRAAFESVLIRRLKPLYNRRSE